jgi:hypothetical protein
MRSLTTEGISMMRSFNCKAVTLICICSFLAVIWATNIVAAETYDPACEFEIDCDADGVYEEDNCPGTPNPSQQDADNDGIGDFCDDDTIYGYIFGEFKDGIDVNIATVGCPNPTIIDTLITDAEGYYSIGDLEDNWYTVYPEDFDYIFVPSSTYVPISKQ